MGRVEGGGLLCSGWRQWQVSSVAQQRRLTRRRHFQCCRQDLDDGRCRLSGDRYSLQVARTSLLGGAPICFVVGSQSAATLPAAELVIVIGGDGVGGGDCGIGEVGCGLRGGFRELMADEAAQTFAARRGAALR